MPGQHTAPETAVEVCTDGCSAAARAGGVRAGDPGWLGAAHLVRWLAWASLLWMTAEGVLGLLAGSAAGSIALIGWALGSTIEGLASVIVVWRFTGSRTLSRTAERRAQRAVAISFWLLAPYIVIEAVRDLVGGHQTRATVLGIVLTASSIVVMPALGIAKRRLGARLGSEATAGEGTQNLICAAQGAAVLLGLAGYRAVARGIVGRSGNRSRDRRLVSVGGRRSMARRRVLLRTARHPLR